MQQNDEQNKQSSLSPWSTPATPKKDAVAHTTPAVVPASSTATYVGMIVVGVIAGVLIAWGWSASRNPSTAGTNATSTEQTSNTNGSTTNTNTGESMGTPSGFGQGSDPAFMIASPQAPGSSVAIQKAMVNDPTWIVIYENKNGQPGNALGATLWFPERQGGSVELLRSTVSGASYLAVKQVDDGDRKFELRGDQYLSEGGEVQWVTFEVR